MNFTIFAVVVVQFVFCAQMNLDIHEPIEQSEPQTQPTAQFLLEYKFVTERDVINAKLSVDCLTEMDAFRTYAKSLERALNQLRHDADNGEALIQVSKCYNLSFWLERIFKAWAASERSGDMWVLMSQFDSWGEQHPDDSAEFFNNQFFHAVYADFSPTTLIKSLSAKLQMEIPAIAKIVQREYPAPSEFEWSSVVPEISFYDLNYNQFASLRSVASFFSNTAATPEAFRYVLKVAIECHKFFAAMKDSHSLAHEQFSYIMFGGSVEVGIADIFTDKQKQFNAWFFTILKGTDLKLASWLVHYAPDFATEVSRVVLELMSSNYVQLILETRSREEINRCDPALLFICVMIATSKKVFKDYGSFGSKVLDRKYVDSKRKYRTLEVDNHEDSDAISSPVYQVLVTELQLKQERVSSVLSTAVKYFNADRTSDNFPNRNIPYKVYKVLSVDIAKAAHYVQNRFDNSIFEHDHSFDHMEHELSWFDRMDHKGRSVGGRIMISFMFDMGISSAAMYKDFRMLMTTLHGRMEYVSLLVSDTENQSKPFKALQKAWKHPRHLYQSTGGIFGTSNESMRSYIMNELFGRKDDLTKEVMREAVLRVTRCTYSKIAQETIVSLVQNLQLSQSDIDSSKARSKNWNGQAFTDELRKYLWEVLDPMNIEAHDNENDSDNEMNQEEMNAQFMNQLLDADPEELNKSMV